MITVTAKYGPTQSATISVDGDSTVEDLKNNKVIEAMFNLGSNVRVLKNGSVLDNDDYLEEGGVYRFEDGPNEKGA